MRLTNGKNLDFILDYSSAYDVAMMLSTSDNPASHKVIKEVIKYCYAQSVGFFIYGKRTWVFYTHLKQIPTWVEHIYMKPLLEEISIHYQWKPDLKGIKPSAMFDYKSKLPKGSFYGADIAKHLFNTLDL